MIAASDALILGMYAAGILGALTVAGLVCDPGGLWDRLCAWLGLDDVHPDELIIRDIKAEKPSRCCPACGDVA